MTRPTNTKDFPKYMFDILERMSEGMDIVMHLKFTSRKQALAFRLDFYTFRRLAIKEGMEVQYPEMREIRIQLDVDERSLMLTNKGNTEVAGVVQKALEEAQEIDLKGDMK